MDKKNKDKVENNWVLKYKEYGTMGRKYKK